MDGAWMVQATLETERRPIMVVSPTPVAEGQRIRVDGAGALWRLAGGVRA